MSADIEKLTVMDSRIVQQRPKYAVEKGALSLTNAPFNAIAATSSQMTFNVYVPSENVFVDRKVQWSTGCYQQFLVQKVSQVTGAVASWVAGDSLILYGTDFALEAFPINSLCATLSATINDTTTVINTQDVLKQVLRLTDLKQNRKVRTTPTMLDKFANYDDASLAPANNPLAGYQGGSAVDEVQNGAFAWLKFTNPSGSYTSPTAYSTAGATVSFTASGTPYVSTIPTTATTPLPCYIYWEATEPIVLSPFVFSDQCEWDTGLFGINNIQLIANLLPASALRTVRNSVGVNGRQIVPGSLNFNTSANNGQVFRTPTLNVTFLTPSLDVPLPPKSVVPYMEFPRYISQTFSVGAMAPGATQQLSSQTITLPTIPDLLIVYVKPQVYTIPGNGLPGTAVTSAPNTDYSQADWTFALGNWSALSPTGAFSGTSINTRPLSLNFDNFSGLLSSVTIQELYNMSVKNGLEMDWNQWIGQGTLSAFGVPQTITAGVPDPAYFTNTTPTSGNIAQVGRFPGQPIPLAGSILVLKPSQDITLQSGQAPSLVGNFTLQYNLSVVNQSDYSAVPVLYTITANSGFFESIRGSSRIIKGVLSEQDIISAQTAPMVTRNELQRMVGGFSLGSLANVATKAMDVYKQTKPLVSAVANMLPDEGRLGTLKKGAKAIGYGTGAGRSLSHRLQ